MNSTPVFEAFTAVRHNSSIDLPFGPGEFVGDETHNFIYVEAGVHWVYKGCLTTCQRAQLNQRLTP